MTAGTEEWKGRKCWERYKNVEEKLSFIFCGEMRERPEGRTELEGR